MRRIAALLLLALAAPLQAQPAPFAGRADLDAARASEEQRLWDAGAEFDRLIGRTGLVVDDPPLGRYLQSVMDRLFPQFGGALRVRVLNQPSLNAFALPNGSIYIHTGLLARFQNEAQLAAVLAHEGAHFTHRHGLQLQERRKTLSVIQLVTSLVGVPYPWVKDLLLASSMFGYSRDMEREADREGWVQLEAAGYDLAEAPRVFEHLLGDLKAAGVEEPFFFSTHPKLQERIDSYRALLAARNAGGVVGREDYLAQVEGWRLRMLAEDLAAGRGSNVLAVLDYGARSTDYPPQALHYLAEALRLRGEPGDVDTAAVLDAHVISTVPDFAPPHFSLGAHHLRRNDWSLARAHLRSYLELAPGGRQRAFALQYLARADRLERALDP